jgi:hypothetical protein
MSEQLLFDESINQDDFEVLLQSGPLGEPEKAGVVISNENSLFVGLRTWAEADLILKRVLAADALSYLDTRIVLGVYDKGVERLSTVQTAELSSRIYELAAPHRERFAPEEMLQALRITAGALVPRHGYHLNEAFKSAVISVQLPKKLNPATQESLFEKLEAIEWEAGLLVKAVFLVDTAYFPFEGLARNLNRRGYQLFAGGYNEEPHSALLPTDIVVEPVPMAVLNGDSSYVGGAPLNKEAYGNWPHAQVGRRLVPLRFLGSVKTAGLGPRVDMYVSTPNVEGFDESQIDVAVVDYDSLPQDVVPKKVASRGAPLYAKFPTVIEAAPTSLENAEWLQGNEALPDTESVVRIVPMEADSSIDVGDGGVVYLMREHSGAYRLVLQSS